jgi:hypothetical protein
MHPVMKKKKKSHAFGLGPNDKRCKTSLPFGSNGKNKIRRKEADEWEMRREVAAHISKQKIIREGKENAKTYWNSD